MTIAFLPWPVSIYEIPGVSIMPPSAHRLSQLSCSVYVCLSPDCKCLILAKKPLWLLIIMLPSLLCVGMRVCRCVHATSTMSRWLSSYLAGGDELERPEGSLHLRDVGLELVESGRNVALDLIGLGPRGAVGRDLVEGLLRHFDGRRSKSSFS
jgi:hypothetical protein